MITRSRGRPRGLAVVGAVVLIGLTGVAFVALASFVRHDLGRTVKAGAEAQLRQLLLAGERAAAAAVDAPPRGVQSVALPAALSAEGATLSFAFPDAAASADTRTADVDAAYAGFHSSQRLTYRRSDGRWALVRAALTEGLPTGIPTTGSTSGVGADQGM